MDARHALVLRRNDIALPQRKGLRNIFGGQRMFLGSRTRYGRRLRMDLVPNRKPTRRTWAMKLEERLAKDLRARGFGAWKG